MQTFTIGHLRGRVSSYSDVLFIFSYREERKGNALLWSDALTPRFSKKYIG
jgi:hypothetical protein